ncbi:hypothetical protein [Neptunomonas qingdaonensis]|uniref:Uncharacterized protein n=1 Tax=Neptunomonas qingdaonensis TaxID=1045558 RepID=A0A1I2W1E0_9GAMM|nr:hypothetical protein [Neptunomonas qingdaonensis]SFG95173.1 hypothetical protein SAMN05216175_12146 [Neptunomonas qingdaonensis]
MTFKSCFSVITLCLLISGCQTASVVPASSGATEPSTGPSDAGASAQQTAAPEPVKQQVPVAAKPARTDNIEYLSGQLSTMQEQIIQIKADTFELKQTSQILLARLQMLANKSGESVATGEEAGTGVASTTEKPDLDQLTARLNTLLKRSDAQYQLASGYTAKGEWVLIRYDRLTGESWLADQGRWNLLNESEEVIPSVFSIQLLRADKDVKGYVVARIDQITGQSWWLKQDTWLMFQ